jgi:hypothetical protein
MIQRYRKQKREGAFMACSTLLGLFGGAIVGELWRRWPRRGLRWPSRPWLAPLSAPSGGSPAAGSWRSSSSRANAEANRKGGTAAAAAADSEKADCASPQACAADLSIIKPMAGEKPGTIHCDSCPVYCTRTVCDTKSCWSERYICGWRACNCKGE